MTTHDLQALIRELDRETPCGVTVYELLSDPRQSTDRLALFCEAFRKGFRAASSTETAEDQTAH